MDNLPGVFQIDNLFETKIKGSGIKQYPHVVTRMREGDEVCVVIFDP
ncbi:MAG: hypothetical protein QGG23_00515 [Candidatus Bathyarchaeota archaeon]|jgi:metal-dependent HD superfamily phosphatase/phosphodiesterase|nr:hypothetical protein [Candidatus Bathyarchaeota archaeon]MDP7207130.1 hypothetical protein [Candidatus Bathyarchaeota archaeon]|tara:strand:+ start:7016 stop:7156 length:141 start_codon:yes stop_codon:yes gene_type:complete